VQGQIVDAAISVPGNVIDPKNWNIPNLGPLVAGQIYQLSVTANVTVHGSREITPCIAPPRSFIAVEDGYLTHSGHAATTQSMFASVMPRYLRMRLQEEFPDVASPAGGLTFGGLLQPNSIYLAYDSDASTLATPVWRDADLPDDIGRWTLRVTQSRGGSHAELVQQTLGRHEFRTPMSFRCDRWSFRGRNVFVFAHSTRGDADSAHLTVVVEPV
jgi:hypothetical protein